MNCRIRLGEFGLWITLFWVTMGCLALFSSDPSLATEIDVVYSFRDFGNSWQEPAFEEATTLATITSTRPIVLQVADDSFVQVASHRYTRIFHWDEVDTLNVVFVDDLGEQIPLRLFPESTHVFDPSNHNVPVICIQTEWQNLFDPTTGLYVWGEHHNWNRRGENWERPATFQYWDSEGSLQISRDIGLRINGGYSRCYQQKSLRLYFDHNGLPESVTHDFFDEGQEYFSRLIVRSGMYPHKLMFDTWACSLFAELGHDISRIKFTTLYVNGEYWGAFNLRERLDDEWLEITYGLDKDHFILLKDGEAQNGNAQVWWDFLAWAGSEQDYTSHAFFREVSSELDMSSYLDWLIINIFLAPSDNGYEHNLVLKKLNDDPWQYVMWDQEDIFHPENSTANYFHFFSAGSEEEFQNWYPGYYIVDEYEAVAPFFLLLNHLMQNAEFRTLFSSRFEFLMAGPMRHRDLKSRLDDIVTEQAPELQWHADQYWNGNLSYYLNLADGAKGWIDARWPLVRQQKNEFMQLVMAPVELSQFTAAEAPDGHLLSWRTESETNCDGFRLQKSSQPEGPFEYFADFETSPELVGMGHENVAADYSFLVTDVVDNAAVYYRLLHVEPGGIEVVHNWIEMLGIIPYSPPLLSINEFMAKNTSGLTDEMGQYEDWVEIYNPGVASVDLGGMFLTDDLGQADRWEFPAQTVLAPGDFLLVWCDSDVDDGPLHASFKLSASGEQCALYSSLADGHELIDSVTFGLQTDDVSQGRECDGCEFWSFFTHSTPGVSNLVQAWVPAIEVPDVTILSAYPNPFNPLIQVEFEVKKPCRLNLAVYDPAGHLVQIIENGFFEAGTHTRSWDGKNSQAMASSAGVYYLRLVGDNGVSHRKITLLK